MVWYCTYLRTGEEEEEVDAGILGNEVSLQGKCPGISAS